MRIFSKIYSLTFFAVTLFSFSVSIAQAQVSSDLTPKSGFFNVTFSQACADSPSGVCQIGWIGEYISAVYNYGVALAAVLAVVAIMVGGFIWLSSAGSPDKVKSGQNIISGALTGLVLALFSFVILQTVNPRLVALEPLGINTVAELQSVCCQSPQGQSLNVLTEDGQCGSYKEGWIKVSDNKCTKVDTCCNMTYGITSSLSDNGTCPSGWDKCSPTQACVENPNQSTAHIAGRYFCATNK